MLEKEDFYTVLTNAVSRCGKPSDISAEVWGDITAKAAPRAVPGDRGASASPISNLAELAERVKGCTACELRGQCTQTVFGEGASDAELMFIGEGPGGDEDRIGRPFVGNAGQLLDKMITAMTFSREEVYIANVVKCRPPGNRAPLPEEVAACMGYLERQIELVAPKTIVLLGATPLRHLLGLEGIKRHRGNYLEYKGIPVMPTFHPAYLLYVKNDQEDKRLVWNDLKQVMRFLGRTPKAAAK